jgi:glycosyltransferase involved in cell wall biosynthesis
MDSGLPTTKVSVLTTVYNGIDFLPETVSSVLEQTFEDFEYIIINDGSTDGTLLYLQQLNDPRIKVVTLPHRGRGTALNAGLKKCKSNYIAILDADDVASKYRLSTQYRFMKKYPDISVLASRCTVNMDTLPDKVFYEDIESQIVLSKEFVKHNPICHSSAMIKMSALQDVGYYNDQRTVLFDYDLWVRLIEKKHSFVSISTPLVYKRIHACQNFERKNRLRYLWEAAKLKYEAKKHSPDHFLDYFYIVFSFLYGLIPVSIRKKMMGRL